MKPEDYCTQQVAVPGSTLHYSYLYLDETIKTSCLAIEAFAHSIKTIPLQCESPDIANAKINWWRQEIANTFKGNPSHPVSHALLEPIQQHDLAISLFRDFIDGIATNLRFQGYHQIGELIQHCHRLTYVPGIFLSKILDADAAPAIKFSHDLGLCLGLADCIMQLRPAAERGCVYLPTELLTKHHVNADQILAGKAEPGLGPLLSELSQQARSYYTSALSALPTQWRSRLSSQMIHAEISLAELAETEKSGFKVLQQQIQLTPLRKYWLARRIHKRARRQKP